MSGLGRGMARFEQYGVRRGAVDKILGVADQTAAKTQAVQEIRALVDQVSAGAMIPSRRIREILKRHGL